MEPANILTLTKTNSVLKLDLSKGGKIIDLILDNHIIIKSPNSSDFLADGSFLMFPWNSRLESTKIEEKSVFGKEMKFLPEFVDGNKTPLHGLFAKTRREIVEFGPNFVKVRPIVDEIQTKNEGFLEVIPDFDELFILSEKKLTIVTEFYRKKIQIHNKLHFSFGYHPYFQIDEEKIDDLIIETNMTDSMLLDEKLLPVKTGNSYTFKKIDLNGAIQSKNFDSCFTREIKESVNFFSIRSPHSNLKLTINDDLANFKDEKLKLDEQKQIRMPFITVYTPDRSRIAIEPQSSGPNSYFMSQENLVQMGEHEDFKFSIFNIELN